MNSEQLWKETNICLDAECLTKAEVINKGADMLLESGDITDRDLFIQKVLEREQFGFTGAGNLVAIPHGISDTVRKMTVALIRTKTDVVWDTGQEDVPDAAKKVRLIILFAVPESIPAETELKYIKALKALCGVLVEKVNVDEIFRAEKPLEIIRIFRKK